MKSAHGHPVFYSAPLVLAVGDGLRANIEEHPNPEEIDHVRIIMDAGVGFPVSIAVNTLSKRNRLAGFDPRVRMAVIRGEWEVLPPRGVSVLSGFDYAAIETSANAFFEHQTRTDLETFLLDRCRRARLLEAWGVPYVNRQNGIHQIHSRRASCAVSDDVVGLDGGLKFYFSEHRVTELVMFKFCGQP